MLTMKAMFGDGGTLSGVSIILFIPSTQFGNGD